MKIFSGRCGTSLCFDRNVANRTSIVKYDSAVLMLFTPRRGPVAAAHLGQPSLQLTGDRYAAEVEDA
ncbi:hypothetical protein AB0C81_18770 [Streptomyces roseoverticillatus]|uniref:hypothetical protein n=1 Tax=Streptomyces roseoverticillatus TaxID=66429 RepID=UPI0033DF2646